MDTAYLLLTVLFSSLGFGYFIYGKKQQNISSLIAGVGLMVYPFFISSVLGALAVGIGLAAVPFVVEF